MGNQLRNFEKESVNGPLALSSFYIRLKRLTGTVEIDNLYKARIYPIKQAVKQTVKIRCKLSAEIYLEMEIKQ